MSVYTTTSEFELEIHADVSPGLTTIAHGPPEVCREGEPPQVEVQSVFILDGDDRFELPSPSPGTIEMCIEHILERTRGGGGVGA